MDSLGWIPGLTTRCLRHLLRGGDREETGTEGGLSGGDRFQARDGLMRSDLSKWLCR